MNEEEIKRYLKEHLEIRIEDGYYAGDGEYIEIKLTIDGEYIDSDTVKINDSPNNGGW